MNDQLYVLYNPQLDAIVVTSAPTEYIFNSIVSLEHPVYIMTADMIDNLMCMYHNDFFEDNNLTWLYNNIIEPYVIQLEHPLYAVPVSEVVTDDGHMPFSFNLAEKLF